MIAIFHEVSRWTLRSRRPDTCHFEQGVSRSSRNGASFFCERCVDPRWHLACLSLLALRMARETGLCGQLDGVADSGRSDFSVGRSSLGSAPAMDPGHSPGRRFFSTTVNLWRDGRPISTADQVRSRMTSEEMCSNCPVLPTRWPRRVDNPISCLFRCERLL